MLASALQSIHHKTKNIPTLTTREPSVSHRTTMAPPTDIAIFQKSHEWVISVKHHLAKIYQFRVQLLPRDIEEIHSQYRQFCDKVLSYSSASAMFKQSDRDGDGKLNEEEQMGIFIHLLKVLYNKKETLIQDQFYKQYANLLLVIEAIQGELPQLERQLRQRISQIKLQYISKCKRKALSQYEVEAQKSQKQLFAEKNMKLESLRYKHQQQIKQLEQKLNGSNTERLYKETKQLSLLEKLSPYRHEKKRDYQCKVLNKTIATTIDQEETRIYKTIESNKNMEKRLLRNLHKRKLQIEEDRYRQKCSELLKNLEKDRDEVARHQDSLLQTLMLKDKKQTNSRVEWIGKSVKVHRDRADSLNIAKIMMQHRDVLQFNNSIERLSTLASQNCDGLRDYKYLGSDSLKYTRRLLAKTNTPRLSNDSTYVIKPGKHESDNISKYQQEGVGLFESTLSQQKSLTDLYDKELNLLN